MTRVIGVDVSYWQGKIDWSKMRPAGAEFAFIRAGQGFGKDTRFVENWTGARGRILRSAYQFFDYRVSAVGQAQTLMGWLGNDRGEMPPTLDWEKNTYWPEIMPTGAAALAIIKAWVDEVKRLDGRKPIFYSNPAHIAALGVIPDWLRELPLFIANYGVSKPSVTGWSDWTFWQYALGKGRGPEFGTTGKDIDLDYFNGNLAELHQFAGVSIPPTPEPEEPEIPPMSMYDSYPKGVMLTNHVADPAKIGGDFMLAYMGKGLTKYEHFHRQVQAAADANKPLIAVYDNDPLVMIQQYESLNLPKWKAEIADNYAIKQMLGPMIQAGGVNRRIHAVIITMNDIYEAPGKRTDPNWIYQTALALAYGVKTLYGLPVYLSIDIDMATAIPHGIDDVFTTFLSKLVDYNAEAQRGYEGVVAGIGTYFNAPEVPVSGTWDAIPVPADGFNQKFKDAKRDSGIGNAPRVHFWCYSAGRVTLPGVGGVAPLYMYMGSKAGLYKELNFTGQPTEPEPEDPPVEPPPDDEEPPVTGDFTAVLTKLAEISTDVKIIRAFIEDMRKL